MINKIKAENENLNKLSFKGAILQVNKINVNPTDGANINKIKFVWKGWKFSFKKSFTASAKGCKIPIDDTLLGPFRDWLSPKILRSIKVRKATLIKTGIMIIKNLKIWLKIIFRGESPLHLQSNALYKL